MRRVFLATLLAALVVLAGCQAPGMGNAAGVDDPQDDPIGWESGYWYNESVSVTASDGLNESEQTAVVSRAMARVEHVRDLEFDESVPVEVINRSEYRTQSGGNHSEALERFDNAKFEAMFLVGEDEGSIEQQEENRGSTVAGYYSPSKDSIVIVSNAEQPVLSSERTLAHELVHALQDQHFGLSGSNASTRDAYQGRTGLIEGDASLTEERYMGHCGSGWSCISADATASSGGGNASSNIHLGLYILQYFPYSEGPNFVASLHDRGGWDAVNDAYENVPDSATEVIDAERYPEFEPANVSVDSVGGEWRQLTPPNRVNYGVLGQSAITASLGYTLYDQYNATRSVVSPTAFLNLHPNGSVKFRQPFNYSIAAADGWAGGRFVAFRNDANETSYVWRTKWDTAAEAAEFADAWTGLIEHWGGQHVAANTYVIESGPYADAFRVTVAGETVTVTNAPDRSDLSAFRGA